MNISHMVPTILPKSIANYISPLIELVDLRLKEGGIYA